MVQAVSEDGTALLDERGREAEVRHVTGRKEKRALTAGEFRELLLQRSVLALVPRDEMRGAGTDAVQARRFDEGRAHARMRGDPEIVVAAEINAWPAVELDVGRVVREAPHVSPPAAEALLIEV